MRWWQHLLWPDSRHPPEFRINQNHAKTWLWQKSYKFMVRYAMSFFPNFWHYKSSTDHKAPCCRSLQGLCSRPWSDLWMQIPICPTDILWSFSLEVLGHKPVDRGIKHEGYRLEQQNLEPQNNQRRAEVAVHAYNYSMSWQCTWVKQVEYGNTENMLYMERTWKYERSECVRVEIKLFADST